MGEREAFATNLLRQHEPCTAKFLCDRLNFIFQWRRRDAQLAIQRAMDQDAIIVGDDWKLTTKK
jgi:hypothetical protein